MRISDWSSDVCSSDLLAEALAHGGIANNARVNLEWIEAEIFEKDETALHALAGVHAILVPGGFGERGSEGKIRDRKSVVSGKSVSVRVDLGGRRLITKQNTTRVVDARTYINTK